MKHYIIIVLLSISLTTCVKPFYPDIDKYEKILVIDGLLTDDGQPASVSISYSYKVTASRAEKVSGATVFINSSDGDRYDLPEAEPGVYRHVGEMFAVSIGKSYQLVVESKGNVFTSSYETMQPTTAITDLSPVVSLKDRNMGLDICVTTQETDLASRYYAWSYEETWKFETEYFTSQFATKHFCFAKKSSAGILIGTTENFADNNLKSQLLYTIPNVGPKLLIRYSVLVKQYSLSRDSYMYLRHIQNVSENNGSLFDPIPSGMSGNIVSGDLPAIGNFQVSGTDSKRIYIHRSDIPANLPLYPLPSRCDLVQSELINSELTTKKHDSLIKAGMVVMDTITQHEVKYERFISSKSCFDCTNTGSPATPPSWWTEKL